MGNVFDIILILVPIITVVICYKLGFFRLLKPFWKVAAFLLAWSLKGTVIVTSTVGKLINADGCKNLIKGRVEAIWGEKIKEAVAADGVTVAERFDEVFGLLGSFFTNVKEFCMKLYGENMEGATESGMTATEKVEDFVMEVTEYATNAVVGFITQLIGFILLYVILMVAFWLISKVLEGIFSEGVFGILNRSIGGLVGVVYGLVIAWLLALVFVLIVPKLSPLEVTEITGGAMGVTKWFYTKFLMSQLLGLTL